MGIRAFLALVEIRTKVASMFPFAAGTLYAAVPYRQFKPVNFILMFVALLFAAAAGSGILLVLNSDVFVLVLGILSFGTGMLYSIGPVPLSGTPLGEFVSGGFMGILIPLVRKIRLFAVKQEKAETFVLSVHNFILQGASLCLLLAAGLAFFK